MKKRRKKQTIAVETAGVFGPFLMTIIPCLQCCLPHVYKYLQDKVSKGVHIASPQGEYPFPGDGAVREL